MLGKEFGGSVNNTLTSTKKKKLVVPEKFYYHRSMKNNNYSRRIRANEINHMNEDDKSMHIFYTLEEIENIVTGLHRMLDPQDKFLGNKIVALEDVTATLENMYSRCKLAKKLTETPALPGVPA